MSRDELLNNLRNIRQMFVLAGEEYTEEDDEGNEIAAFYQIEPAEYKAIHEALDSLIAEIENVKIEG